MDMAIVKVTTHATVRMQTGLETTATQPVCLLLPAFCSLVDWLILWLIL
jgi:hypothetical protein